MSKLFIVSGPSGVGKGTLMRFILDKYEEKGIFFSVSATTRAPREGEKHGVNYLYITRDEFTELLNNDGLLEYNILSTGDMYGTPKAPLEEALAEGRPCILEIEPNGMRSAIKTYPDAIKIFISPPSIEILEKRLRDRGTENEQQIIKRVTLASEEMKTVGEYDHVIVNDGLEDAIKDIDAVFARYID